MAREMITKYGMDPDLGTLQYLNNNDYSLTNTYSEATAVMIDQKVQAIVRQCYDQAKTVLKSEEVLIHKLAKLLDAKEYLTREEFEEIMSAQADKVDGIITRMIEEYNEQVAKAEALIAKMEKKKKTTKKIDKKANSTTKKIT